MNVIDLCAGIGGISLGFEREGFRTSAFCEIDERCQAVLRARWPHVPIYGDVRDRDGIPLPGSIGGRKTRWPIGLSELLAIRHPWIVAENVQHTWRRWVPELRRHLHGLGYSSVPLRVSAAELGGRHHRRRVFVVAHTDSERLRELSRWWSREGGQVADELASTWDSAPRRLGANDGLPNWSHRRHALGNAVVPQAMQLIGRALSAETNGVQRE